MDKIVEAKMIRGIIERICRDVIEMDTADCFRLKKAKVKIAPNGSVCFVQLVGDSSVLSLPYSSACSSVSVGDMVWVGVIGNNMASALVWQTANFN